MDFAKNQSLSKKNNIIVAKKRVDLCKIKIKNVSHDGGGH